MTRVTERNMDENERLRTRIVELEGENAAARVLLDADAVRIVREELAQFEAIQAGNVAQSEAGDVPH